MKETLLGRKVASPCGHDPSILTPIERQARTVAMHGFDLWRAYELSWLDDQGRPQIGMLEIVYPAESRCIVESKSLKLYLNGLAYAHFPSMDDVKQTIQRDLSAILQTPWLMLTIVPPAEFAAQVWQTQSPGTSLDTLSGVMGLTSPDPTLLETATEQTHETLSTDLLRTLCPITGQPDWGTVIITYRGGRIAHTGLLGYIYSFREHQGFHEECCERIFTDITLRCAPDDLMVGCWYTRRGGIDINPVRASYPLKPQDMPRLRLIRQ